MGKIEKLTWIMFSSKSIDGTIAQGVSERVVMGRVAAEIPHFCAANPANRRATAYDSWLEPGRFVSQLA